MTEADIRNISLSGGGGGGGGAPAMQTAAMRELKRLQALKEYSHAVVRVRLPGGLLVQGCFHPQEPVSHVLDHVASCLSADAAAIGGAYLFTTPPRTVLAPGASLVEAGLSPAATAVLAWPRGLPPQLAALPPEALLAEHARALLEANASGGGGGDGAFPTARGAAADGASGASGAASSRSGDGGGGASAVAGGAGPGEPPPEKKRPKWLKM